MGEDRTCWHEVTVAPYTDPKSGHPSLLITQSDVTGRAETEAALSQLNEVGGSSPRPLKWIFRGSAT